MISKLKTIQKSIPFSSFLQVMDRESILPKQKAAIVHVLI
jgi:hypothetical protein